MDVPQIAVLLEDAWTVVVDKPSGMLVHNSAWSGPREHTLVEQVARQRGERLVPIHRLDRGASGVLVMSTKGEHARAWTDALASPSTRKVYLALVRGRICDGREVDHPVRDDTGTRREARSSVRPLAVSRVDRCSLVEVELHSGRHHQVRRHLQHISHPIVGDSTHGKGDINRHYRETYAFTRLALHARELHVVHPFTAVPLVLCAPLPEEMKRLFASLFPEGPMG